MWLRALWMVVLLSVLGCSQGEDEVDNAVWRGEPEVVGIVTLDAKPLADAKVSFDPATGASLVAVTDESGRFSLDLTGAGESAVGKYAVRIRLSPEGAADSDRLAPIPLRYNESTELVVDIRDGLNTFDFSLLSGESTGE